MNETRLSLCPPRASIVVVKDAEEINKYPVLSHVVKGAKKKNKSGYGERE